MTTRSYLSIGQVLDLLKQEFPDLTISKIRFLESQGLLDPERTPSGYRKFYDPDVERLRFILRAQQDQYLPLKVIKGRLGEEEGDATGEEPEDAGMAASADRGGSASPVARATPDAPSGASSRASSAAPAAGGTAVAAAYGGDAGNGTAAPAYAGIAEGRPQSPSLHAPRGRRDDIDLGASRHPSMAPAAAGRPAPGAPLRTLPDEGDDASLTLEELGTVSGLSLADLSELERFGLISGRRIAGTTYYDTDCATIAGIAARFRAFGVEARHLRMYRTAVEREAGFFEQVVTPMLKQRNPQARRQAVDALLEMSRLGSAMRESVLRLALRDYTGGLP
ncbi:MAG TPA: MerR family transcriptional regulator [Acidimicrobiales bacterium]|nr:MerR family transcriptional regulator [Acidimicrobiales bacterium]